MRTVALAMLVPIAVGLLCGMADPPVFGGGDGVAAIVNNEVITRYDIEKLLTEGGTDLMKLPESQRQKLFDQTLLDEIYKRLRIQATRRAGIAIGEEDLLNMRNRSIAQQFESEARFRDELRRSGLSEEQWNQHFREGQESLAWLNAVSGRSGAASRGARPLYDLSCTPRELRRFYNRRKQDLFTSEDRVRLSVIQVYFRRNDNRDRTRVRGVMNSLKLKVSGEGADFAVLAAKNSAHPTAEKGGRIEDWVEKGGDKVDPEIEKRVFAEGVEIGTILGPIRLINSYWLVRVEAREHARVIPFSEAQRRCRGEVQARKQRRAYQHVILDLIKDAYIYPSHLKSSIREYLTTRLAAPRP